MKSRVQILKDLVGLNGDLTVLKAELSQYTWDMENPLLIITTIEFVDILNKCINGEISYEDLEYWANLVECRDDIGFENDKVQEMVFELASPEINEKITKEKLMEYVRMLI